MNQTPLVSVIVPVYNCKDYIADCIHSVLCQTFSSFELLLIDDGSTDGSGDICDTYAKEDSIRIFHQSNQGVSATRNRGIELSLGEYILFLDSDDTIEPAMLETMVHDIKSRQADVVFCGMIHEYPDHQRIFPKTPITFTTDGIGAIREVLINYIATAGPVCKLFRKDCLTNDLFPLDLTIGEDAVAVVSALLTCQTAVFHTLPFYHYNHREGSLMSSHFKKHDLDLITAYERIEKKLPNTLKKEADFRLIWAHFHVFDKMISDKTAWKKGNDYGIVPWIRRHFFSILFQPYVGIKRKIALCALLFSRRLYRYLVL